MQKIRYSFNLRIAKIIPQAIVAGKAGGTAMTIKLRVLSRKVSHGAFYFIMIGNKQRNPIIAIRAITKTNLIPSL
jgi:hypothetical protein